MNRIHRDESALYHACGYSCDHGIYLQLGSDACFITDGRYAIDAQRYVRNAEVIIARDLIKEASKRICKSTVAKIIYDPKEWDVYSFDRLRSKSKTRWKPKPLLSQKLRIIKSRDAITLLDEAARIGAKVFDALATRINAKGVGLSERQLFAMAQEMLGGDEGRSLSFDPIVAIGANAAKPHANPDADTVLKRGDLLLLDAGIKYKRYCSDRTRTVRVKEHFVFDTNQHFKDKQTQKAYDTVRKAHDKAIAKARSGMRARTIDAIARDVIDKAGFGKYFVHSTGHGVGLDIHELPVISSKSRTRIKDGMVYTIEPGIYIPGAFGIRIEDTVVMEEGRARVLGN